MNVMIGLSYQQLDLKMSRTGDMCLWVFVRECSESIDMQSGDLW